MKTTNGMFLGCSSLESLDLSGWDTSAATDMDFMFYDCSKLETVLVGPGWSTEGVNSSNQMFDRCTSIVGGNGTVYDPDYIDKAYARADLPGEPGYLTFILRGRWGTCPWGITADGVLTVHPGEGASQEGKDVSPWDSYSDIITSVIFAEEGGRKVVAPTDSSKLLGWLATRIEADVAEKGSVVVGARFLGEMLRRLPDGIVTVSTDANLNVTVK